MSLPQFLLALGILLGAGLSDLIGQSVVLFLNRVPPRRFVLCLLSGSVLFATSAALWTVSLWALSRLLPMPLGLWQSFGLVGFAHAPMLFAWTELLPHLGRFLFHALRAAVFFNLVVAVGLLTHAGVPAAMLICLPGWLVHFSLTHLELVRLERFQAALWRALTGSELSR